MFASFCLRRADTGGRLFTAGVTGVGSSLQGPASTPGQRLQQEKPPERRVKTPFTNAEPLPQVLNRGADVFRSIAAEWKKVDPDSVTDSLRQQAKQVRPQGEARRGRPRFADGAAGLCRSAMVSSTEWGPGL